MGQQEIMDFLEDHKPLRFSIQQMAANMDSGLDAVRTACYRLRKFNDVKYELITTAPERGGAKTFYHWV